MKVNKEFLLNFAEEILHIDSPTGYTKNIIAHLVKIAKNWKIAYELNKKGNLILTVPGESTYTVGLAAHVDTLGAMVRSVSSDGTLKFTVLGGPILPTYDGEYCKIYTRNNEVITGTFLSNSASVHVHEDAKTLARNEKNMYIRLDKKVKSKEDTLKLGIRTGDFIAIDPKTTITSDGFIKSRFLDDKISVAILFTLLKYFKDEKITPKFTLKFIISTYEEVGHGTANIPDMDEMLAVDMGCIGEDLSCTEYDVSICAKDSSGPYDYDMTNKLIQTADRFNLDYAVDIYPFYGSDVSAALRGGNNIKGALIGPGVHASHGMERTHYDGVENTLKLLLGYLT